MSLVAYGDDSEDEDILNENILANSSSVGNSSAEMEKSDTDSTVPCVNLSSDSNSSVEIITAESSTVKKHDPVLKESSSGLQNDSMRGKDGENRSRLFCSLPPPVTSSREIYLERQKVEDSPKGYKRKPSLDFVIEEKEEQSVKKRKTMQKGSQLFAILPPPKAVPIKEVNRPLVPNLLTKKTAIASVGVKRQLKGKHLKHELQEENSDSGDESGPEGTDAKCNDLFPSSGLDVDVKDDESSSSCVSYHPPSSWRYVTLSDVDVKDDESSNSCGSYHPPTSWRYVTLSDVSSSSSEQPVTGGSLSLDEEAKGSQLFAILPPPKAVPIKEVNRPLVPNLLTKKTAIASVGVKRQLKGKHLKHELQEENSDSGDESGPEGTDAKCNDLFPSSGLDVDVKDDESSSSCVSYHPPSSWRYVTLSDVDVKDDESSNSCGSYHPPSSSRIVTASDASSSSEQPVTGGSLSLDEEAKGSQLFAILPPPKAVPIKEVNRPLVPNLLTKKTAIASVGVKRQLKGKHLKHELQEENSDSGDESGPEGTDAKCNDLFPSSGLDVDVKDDESSSSCVSYHPPSSWRYVTLSDVDVKDDESSNSCGSYHPPTSWRYVTLSDVSSSSSEQPVTGGSLSLDEEAFKRLDGPKYKQQMQAMEIIDISEDTIMPDSNEWLTKQLTVETNIKIHGHSHRKNDGPTTQQRRKHQITYLAFQAKEKELE